MGEQLFGVDPQACLVIAKAIKTLTDSGIQVGIVVGGGNIYRGIHLEEMGLSRTPADHMGMLATMINGIALKEAFLSLSCPAVVMSGLECPKAVESYSHRGMQEELNKGNVLIFSGGTGNPYFTTDTAAALRASEMGADLLLKATKVDGVYDEDPVKNPHAQKYSHLTFSKLLADHLHVMDATAIALCRESDLPIFVFNMKWLKEEYILDLVKKREPGTLVSNCINSYTFGQRESSRD